MADVFISYSSKDKLVADAACAVLEQRKLRCWIAPRDIIPGMQWGASIIEAIGSAKVMVLIVSGNANSSPQIEREVERAVHLGVPIIPFRIEDIQPTKSLEYFISASHWLDAFTPPVEQHLDRLARVVQSILRQAMSSIPVPGAGSTAARLALQPTGGTASPWDRASGSPKRTSRLPLIAVAGLAASGIMGGLAWLVLRPGASPPQVQRVASTPSAEPAEPASPTPLIPEEIPFLHDAEQATIRAKYLPAAAHKVLAISYSAAGFAAAQSDDTTAREIAVDACRSNTAAAGTNFPCSVYAVGNNVVSKAKLPPTPPTPWVVDDPTIVQPFTLDRLPLASAGTANLRNYASATGSKALALSPSGGANWRMGNASASEAVRRTLQICGAMGGVSCTIVAVDNNFVVPITTSMKPTGLFQAVQDADIAPELRANVARRLANHPGGWNAVSVGEAGIPGVATKLETETAAIESAQASCQKADRRCHIIAIGPFRVEPLPPLATKP